MTDFQRDQWAMEAAEVKNQVSRLNANMRHGDNNNYVPIHELDKPTRVHVKQQFPTPYRPRCERGIGRNTTADTTQYVDLEDEWAPS